jgi:hypothetical protein
MVVGGLGVIFYALGQTPSRPLLNNPTPQPELSSIMFYRLRRCSSITPKALFYFPTADCIPGHTRHSDQWLRGGCRTA